ncbi:MAG: single-stranded DNA-binding protein [Clostridium sp.]|nr:single-stranded DNA-binding protein [Clostridium sp.]
MNKVIMMGRLTRDPEIRYSHGANGTTIARFSLAVDRRWKREGEPDADFFNCTAFGRQAEFAEKYLRQGIKIVVTGRMQNNNYTNKDGEKVYSIQIMVEEIEFAESKNAQQSGQDNSGTQDQPRSSVPAPDSNGFMKIPEGAEDDLPFN